ncbi:hypothetical protein [Paraferrimonas sp. SM1919]|uniref:hypothetical protein n=1 Tax=Paraferrimonas sp. SM1919 TaxID=2662263 RepID=UPI0013D65360|nr:hypothetical protein [Paraferrimonas sp. SM1919]
MPASINQWRKKLSGLSIWPVLRKAIPLLLGLVLVLLIQFKINTGSEHSIIDSNDRYLDQISLQATTDILLLTEVDAVLNILKSSQVGVSFIADFNVTVGQAISEVQSTTSEAKKVMMISLVLITVLKTLNDLSLLLSEVALYIAAGAGFIHYLLLHFKTLSMIPHTVLNKSAAITKIAAMIFISFYLLLPYSIHGSGVLSERLQQSTHVDNSQSLNHLHQHITQGKGTKELSKSAKASISHLSSMSHSSIKDKVQTLIKYTITAATLWLFNLILMPLGIGFMLYKITLQLLSYEYYQPTKDH